MAAYVRIHLYRRRSVVALIALEVVTRVPLPRLRPPSGRHQLHQVGSLSAFASQRGTTTM